MSYGAIHVKSYVLKVNTIKKVGLELIITSSNHCGRRSVYHGHWFTPKKGQGVQKHYLLHVLLFLARD